MEKASNALGELAERYSSPRRVQLDECTAEWKWAETPFVLTSAKLLGDLAVDVARVPRASLVALEDDVRWRGTVDLKDAVRRQRGEMR